MTQGSPNTYAEKMYNEYKMSLQGEIGDLRPLEDAMLKMNKFADTLGSCCDVLLQEGGCGEDWRQADKIYWAIKSAIRDLESYYCELL